MKVRAGGAVRGSCDSSGERCVCCFVPYVCCFAPRSETLRVDAPVWLAISLFFFLVLFRGARNLLTASCRIVKRRTATASDVAEHYRE